MGELRLWVDERWQPIIESWIAALDAYADEPLGPKGNEAK